MPGVIEALGAPAPTRCVSPAAVVVEARLGHVLAVARRLDVATLDCAARSGIDARRHLVGLFRASSACRALLIDRRCVAIGGIVGALLAPAAHLWLALTDLARAHPKTLVSELRCQLAQAVGRHGRVETLVDVGDVRAVRFAEFMGLRPLSAAAPDGMCSYETARH